MEQIDVALQKLGAALLWQKLAGLAALVVLLCGGYWYFFLDDIWTQRNQFLAEQNKLNQEKRDYEARKKEYLAYKKEIAQLLEEQRDILRLLPKKDDIEQFVEALQQQMELTGLQRPNLVRDPPVP
jgi:Tfp pilus assembly protein PilO